MYNRSAGKNFFAITFLYAFFQLSVLLPSALHGQSADTKLYVSSNKIFIVTYPADWKKNNQETSEFAINAPGASIFKICMVKMEINKMMEGYEKYNIKQLSEVEMKMMKAQGDQLEVQSSEFKKIKDQDWWMLKGKMTKGREVFFYNSYKTIHSGKVYVFTYFSREKDYDKNFDAANKMFDSIEFLTKNEPNNK